MCAAGQMAQHVLLSVHPLQFKVLWVDFIDLSRLYAFLWNFIVQHFVTYVCEKVLCKYILLFLTIYTSARFNALLLFMIL